MLCFFEKVADMKEQDPLQPASPGSGQKQNTDKEPITSDSIKNAHAAGDGAMERSSDSIPDEEDLKGGDKNRPRRAEQY